MLSSAKIRQVVVTAVLTDFAGALVLLPLLFPVGYIYRRIWLKNREREREIRIAAQAVIVIG